MANFEYVARDTSGRRVTGTLAAASEQAVLAELEGRELSPVRLAEIRRRPRLRRRVAPRHLSTAYRQLADLLRVGMPILKALELLGRNRSNPPLAAVMRDVSERVAEGSRLADAMGRHPDVFPPIQIAMIRAGERGAFLEQVCARLGEFIERQADLRSKVAGTLIYPCVLLTVGAGVVVWALTFQVPRFAALFERIQMPLPTRMLLGASAVLRGQWPILLVGGVLLAVAAAWLLRRPGVREALVRTQLHVPGVAQLAGGLAVARFARTLGTLLHNGVPMLAAMQISRDALGHPLLGRAIDRAAEAVRAGEPLARPMAESGMFAEDVAEMIAVGESANNLPEVLITIAETIEKRVDRMLALLVRLMEPLLLLLLAGVVMFIFAALVVPMLRMSSAL
jgi:general secretion pathway protein F/type IV pilus assembly protein PilC